MIQTLGMLLDFQKAKNTRLAARFFHTFLKSRNIQCVWITLSKHGKPSGISLMFPSNEISTLKKLKFVSCIAKTPSLLMENTFADEKFQIQLLFNLILF